MDVPAPVQADAVVPDDVLILVATREVVLFPGAVVPLAVTRPATVEALQAAARKSQHVVVVLQRDASVDAPALADLHGVGTEARLLRYLTTPDGTHHAIIQGTGRARIISSVEGLPYPAVRIERITEPEADGAEIAARTHQLRERALETVRLLD